MALTAIYSLVFIGEYRSSQLITSILPKNPNTEHSSVPTYIWFIAIVGKWNLKIVLVTRDLATSANLSMREPKRDCCLDSCLEDQQSASFERTGFVLQEAVARRLKQGSKVSRSRHPHVRGFGAGQGNECQCP